MSCFIPLMMAFTYSFAPKLSNDTTLPIIFVHSICLVNNIYRKLAIQFQSCQFLLVYPRIFIDDFIIRLFRFREKRR